MGDSGVHIGSVLSSHAGVFGTESNKVAVKALIACDLYLKAWLSGRDINNGTQRIRQASSETQIWLQVRLVVEAVGAAASDHAPDVFWCFRKSMIVVTTCRKLRAC